MDHVEFVTTARQIGRICKPRPTDRFLGYNIPDPITAAALHFRIVKAFEAYQPEVARDASPERIQAIPAMALAYFPRQQTMVVHVNNDEAYGNLRRIAGQPHFQIEAGYLKV